MIPLYVIEVTYIGSREGKTLDLRMRTGGKTLQQVEAAPLVGPGKGRRCTLSGLGCTHAGDKPSPVQRPKLVQRDYF